jgi:hypothetical protein
MLITGVVSVCAGMFVVLRDGSRGAGAPAVWLSL